MAIAPPFGWIMDGTQRSFAPVVFYRRGIPFEEVIDKEKEWMYLQFWSKDSGVDTIKSLIEVQNESLKDIDKQADIRVFEQDGLTVREARLPSYPTTETTVFREFDRFIAFLVLFCPEHFIQKDTKKAIIMLKEAIPIRVRIESEETATEN